MSALEFPNLTRFWFSALSIPANIPSLFSPNTIDLLIAHWFFSPETLNMNVKVSNSEKFVHGNELHVAWSIERAAWTWT